MEIKRFHSFQRNCITLLPPTIKWYRCINGHQLSRHNSGGNKNQRLRWDKFSFRVFSLKVPCGVFDHLLHYEQSKQKQDNTHVSIAAIKLLHWSTVDMDVNTSAENQ